MYLQLLWKFPSLSCPSDNTDSFSPSSVDTVPWLSVSCNINCSPWVLTSPKAWGKFPPGSALLLPDHLTSPSFRLPISGSSYPPANLPVCHSVTPSLVIIYHILHSLMVPSAPASLPLFSLLLHHFIWPQHLYKWVPHLQRPYSLPPIGDLTVFYWPHHLL